MTENSHLKGLWHQLDFVVLPPIVLNDRRRLDNSPRLVHPKPVGPRQIGPRFALNSSCSFVEPFSGRFFPFMTSGRETGDANRVRR